MKHAPVRPSFAGKVSAEALKGLDVQTLLLLHLNILVLERLLCDPQVHVRFLGGRDVLGRGLPGLHGLLVSWVGHLRELVLLLDQPSQAVRVLRKLCMPKIWAHLGPKLEFS